MNVLLNAALDHLAHDFELFLFVRFQRWIDQAAEVLPIVQQRASLTVSRNRVYHSKENIS